MVAGNGEAARISPRTATQRRGGALHYIVQRTVVLDKVEVRGSNGMQGHAEIAHYGNGFQENLGKQNRRAPVEIHTARMHLLHQGTEKTEVQMRRSAQGGAVRGRVHVGNVGADSEVNGDRD